MTWEMPVFPVESCMLREISNPSVGGSNPPGRIFLVFEGRVLRGGERVLSVRSCELTADRWG